MTVKRGPNFSGTERETQVTRVAGGDRIHGKPAGFLGGTI
jgi:hypothetical protein